MMRLTLSGVLLALCAPVMLAAQAGTTNSTTQPPAGKSVSPPMTLVGCVQGTGAVGDPFRLSDLKAGVAYRLTGSNLRAYMGKKVQIAGGSDDRRLKIVGGLVPSANVAGQAGAMDPSRAAVESDPSATAGKSEPPLPEFRVRSVRTVGGACEQ